MKGPPMRRARRKKGGAAPAAPMLDADLGSEERRVEILSAAMRRFLAYGVRKTAMREIADDCGLAVGTLYLSFPSKEQLVIGCAEVFESAHARDIEAIVTAPAVEPRERLSRYILARYQASQAIRAGNAQAAAELASYVLRLRPNAPLLEAERFEANIALILSDGWKSGKFPGVEDPPRDARAFALALGVFFPIPGREGPHTLARAHLHQQIDWFLGVFSRRRDGSSRP